ncbi:hypothetical protein ACFQ1E_01220 [Sphingomonas canadensis]|uniref:Uncharacterized protein n=1 Tax=Sphingomonas canadensis TaxID=1219257 RepID=A0ABW3H1D6_9SPHN|nr:hypothetical protein [Sphingomonas canadensis]MCW3835138.1 hypothetical protein [Sphingomonas canadensis]
MIIEHQPAPPGTSTNTAIDRIEAILKRYPEVSPEEAAEAERFLAEAPILDRGLLSSRPGMQAKMELLRKHRPKAFAPSMLGRMILLAMILLVVATGFLTANL